MGLLALLDTNLIHKATTGESRVFYRKMKADYFRYIAEFASGEKRRSAAEAALEAYQDAQKIAATQLTVTHPVRLGLALNFSVFLNEILSRPGEAHKLARE